MPMKLYLTTEMTQKMLNICDHYCGANKKTGRMHDLVGRLLFNVSCIQKCSMLIL